MIRLETTPRCGRTPDVVLALEELGVPYELVQQNEGHFTETYGRMGPLLRDGELAVFEPTAIIRHLGRTHGPAAALPDGAAEHAQVDGFMDLVYSQLRPALARLGPALMASGGGNPAVIAEEMGRLNGVLKYLERTLSDREFLLGRFTVADCTLTLLPMLVQRGFDFSAHPAVVRYVARLTARPSWAKMSARCQLPAPQRPVTASAA